MKKAKLVAVAVEVHCPHCDEPAANPSDGSHMWEKPQVDGAQLASSIKCFSCGKEFKVACPSKVDFA